MPNSQELPNIMYGWRVTCVQKRLEQLGKSTGPLTVEDLTSLGHLDQYHYYETEACDEAIQRLKIDDGKYVLDIGSGIGGPARYISQKTQAAFTCVEMQEDLNHMARLLTERVGLQQKIEYLTGDFMKLELPYKKYDNILSFLVFLHMSEKPQIFNKCFQVLKPGGQVLIEDLFRIGDFDSQEKEKLQDVISAKELLTVDDYVTDLQQAGFTDLIVEDLTTSWSAWCNRRHQQFILDKNNIILYGEKIFASRSHFYCTVKDLFNGGNLGGVRIIGKRPE